MLQVNPSNRPTTDQLLNNDIVLKRISEPSMIHEVKQNNSANMLNTIKLPKNINEINRALPKQKRYKQQEEMMMANVDQAPMKEYSKKENNPLKELDRKIEDLKAYNKNNDYVQIKNNAEVNSKEKEAALKLQMNQMLQRPSSGKSDARNDKSPIYAPVRKEVEIIKSKPYDPSPQLHLMNKNVIVSSNRNLEKNNMPIKIQNPIYNNEHKSKPVSTRPESAKINGREAPNYNAPVLVRKGISERPLSSKVNSNPLIRREIQKSPLIRPVVNKPIEQRPSSGKDKMISPVSNKVVIEKVNYQRPIQNMNNRAIHAVPLKLMGANGLAKPNYHYNQANKIIVNNKQNLINAMKVNPNEKPTSQNGPRIVLIRK